MGKYEKLLHRVTRGLGDRNIPFDDLVNLLKRLGFQERIKGSHHIMSKSGVKEILNIQPKLGKAKPY